MPVYQCQCTDENCGRKAPVIAGLDDAMAICSRCGDLMLRLDEAHSPLIMKPLKISRRHRPWKSEQIRKLC